MCKKICVINFFVFFLLFFLNNKFLHANIKPYCDNKISQDFFYKIDHNLPQLIEIKVNKNRKWQKNNLRIIKDNSGIIHKKYKKKFKAKLSIKFDDKTKCEFGVKIRQNGDWTDHIQFVDGKFYQSLDVDLDEGHINGITQLKLLIPETRGNPDDEIILTELLRELGFLAPRTSLIKVNFNGVTKTMLLEEKVEKELLEYHNKREGPILEGDERYWISFEDKSKLLEVGERAQLSKQTNVKWFAKGKQHENISHTALTRLNQIYLSYIHQYQHVPFGHNFTSYYLNNNLLALNNPYQILNLDIYNAIIFAANAHHSLRPHNRKFYWNAINNYFEPIYYDGNVNIDANELDLRFPNNDYFLLGIREAKKKIKKIKIVDFFNKIHSRGSTLTKDKIKKKLDKIIINLNNMESRIDNSKVIENQNRNVPIDNNIWSNYIDSTLKITSDIILVVRNSKNDSFIACDNLQLNCNQVLLESDQIEDLLRGRLSINGKTYQYIGEYNSITNHLNLNELIIVRLSKYKKVNFKDTNFFYDKNITFEFDKENLIFNIYQNKFNARAYFLGGNLKDIHVNLFNSDTNKYNNLSNYIFDKNGLTGCLSFIDMYLKNITINSYNSSCEDSINLINTTGQINNIQTHNAKSDALDIDFSNIKIDQIYINKAKNDCVDLSSGKYEFGELNLSECNDKALSVGEKSTVKLSNLLVLNSTIGFSTKDSSTILIDNLNIENTKICFEAKRKKQEFLGGIINLSNYNCNGSPISIGLGSFVNYN